MKVIQQEDRKLVIFKKGKLEMNCNLWNLEDLMLLLSKMMLFSTRKNLIMRITDGALNEVLPMIVRMNKTMNRTSQ